MPNIIDLSALRAAVPGGRSSASDSSAAHHYGDERLRQIAAELKASHELQKNLHTQVDRIALRKAEAALADGTNYTEAKRRCKALGQPFGPWVAKHAPHKWRMADYLMAAVRLGVDSQSIANFRGRPSSRRGERTGAQRGGRTS